MARAVRRRRWEEEKEAVARVWAAREAGTLTEVEVGGEARAEAAMVVAAKELGEAATEVMVAAVAAVAALEVARVGGGGRRRRRWQ